MNSPVRNPEIADLLDSGDAALYDVATHGPGPEGKLPLTDEFLRRRPSGDAFGMTEDAGMGWKPERLAGPPFVMLSTMGGLRADDGQPIALGHVMGHAVAAAMLTALRTRSANRSTRSWRRFAAGRGTTMT